ncbi:molybdate ABC transporter permease subunit [Nibrella saemangeumensis]|uniref:Molybdenum transport system permease n=1 Tax=Nibrella saemangeumensis TaxID=1084526 RepID=A0ABP8MKD1_9BACT
MTDDFSQTLLLTLSLAGLTTAVLLVIGIPLAYWLAYGTFRLKPFVEAVVSLPLVLPPTVTGFYLLIAFSEDSMLGYWLINTLGLRLNFTFTGILVGSLFYSLPFMVHPIQSGFQNLPASLREASFTLGKSELTTLGRVLLPNIKPALLSGMVLAFAHTIGEFGLVLMIGGNIPGKTRVASIAIYDEVESLNYDRANAYALVLLGLTFSILLVLFWFNKKLRTRTFI